MHGFARRQKKWIVSRSNLAQALLIVVKGQTDTVQYGFPVITIKSFEVRTPPSVHLNALLSLNPSQSSSEKYLDVYVFAILGKRLRALASAC